MLSVTYAAGMATRQRKAPASAPTRGKRAAVYLRISKDRDGTQDATERQLEACQHYAKAKGLDIVDVFEDVDLSAYRKGVVRPAYQEMLEGIREDAYDVVLVFRIDRLVRRTIEFAHFWELAEAHGVDLLATDQPIDTSDELGRLIVNILVAFAEMESATISARMRNKEAFMAKKGVHKGAGRRAYGMQPGWKKTNPKEVAVIRELAERLLAGETVGALVRDLNARNVPSATGRKWSRRGLVVLMRQARLFGWREHHGELVAKGDWPVILDEATGRKLRKLLAAPMANRGGQQTRRTYMLSGLLRCGKCGGRMKHARQGGTAGHRYRKYVCSARTDGGCSGSSIMAIPTEDAISQMVLHRLNSGELAKTLRSRKKRGKAPRDAELLAELHQLEERAGELAEQWAKGTLSMQAYQLAQAALDEELTRVHEDLADLVQAEPLADLLEGADGLGRAWESMTVDRQRAVMDVLLDAVIVHGKDPQWKKGKVPKGSILERSEGPDYFPVRLRAALLREADEAEAAGDNVLAKRRRKQAESRTAGGGNFRPERLEPIWKV